MQYKGEKTPWNTIEPTKIPIEASKNARFEVGKLREEDIQKEIDQLQNNFERFEKQRERREIYENNFKSILEFPPEDEYFQ